MKSPQQYNRDIGNARAWFIWCLTALAFGYAFFQRVAPGSMVSDLMAEFSIGATVLGTLSALYFYPYVLMQIPLGVLIDRWGARILLTVALTVAGGGSFLFATAQSLEVAYAGRLLIGIGCAVGFLGSLAIAASWFPPKRFAFLSGLVMFFGMMSGVFAQGPLAAFVDAFGWRTSMWVLGFSGISLGFAIFLFVRNTPDDLARTAPPNESWRVIGKGIRQAVGNREVWKIAIVAFTMSAPMLTIGALWGTPYMQVAHDLDKTQAASLVSLLLFGWAFGAPFAGWLSDRIHKRKALLVSASFLLVLSVGALAFVPSPSFLTSIILLILIGVFGSFMAICFALARENSPPAIGASVIGIVNSMTVASGAILQPAVGYMLDGFWDGHKLGEIKIYTAENFQISFIPIFVTCLIGLITCLLLKESNVWKHENH